MAKLMDQHSFTNNVAVVFKIIGQVKMERKINISVIWTNLLMRHPIMDKGVQIVEVAPYNDGPQDGLYLTGVNM